MAVKIDGTLGIDKIKDGSVTSSDLIDSINLPGSPTVATPTPGTNSNKLATTAYVDGKMVLGTSVATTSGTSIDFTGIPSWVRRISVFFNKVSTSGSSAVILQIGCSANGVETSGYNGAYISIGSGTVSGNLSSSFQLENGTGASYTKSGVLFLSLMSTNNTWTESAVLGHQVESYVKFSGGIKSLGGPLDRIRITIANGTDTFTGGSINIMYEG
jgi:hypothetical protein